MQLGARIALAAVVPHPWGPEPSNLQPAPIGHVSGAARKLHNHSYLWQQVGVWRLKVQVGARGAL